MHVKKDMWFIIVHGLLSGISLKYIDICFPWFRRKKKSATPMLFCVKELSFNLLFCVWPHLRIATARARAWGRSL